VVVEQDEVYLTGRFRWLAHRHVDPASVRVFPKSRSDHPAAHATAGRPKAGEAGPRLRRCVRPPVVRCRDLDVLGIALAAACAVLLGRTRLGFAIRVQGENPEAARYVGINALKTTLLVMLLSGGAAGLAGVGEVAGVHHKLLDPNQVSLGYGYTAIIVAWLARGKPLSTLVTATLFGLIYASGDVMQVSLQMPFRVTSVFNGLILFSLIGSERLLAYRVRWAPARLTPAPAAARSQPSDEEP